MNPKDERYAHLIGKHVRRPLPVEDQALLPILNPDEMALPHAACLAARACAAKIDRLMHGFEY